jgi:hypothetical protein
MKLLATFALGVALAAMPIRAQGQNGHTETCQWAGLEAEQVAVDRDSGMPRELAAKHLLNTITEQLGSMPDDEALRNKWRDLSAGEVTMIYGDLRNLRPDVIKIEFESICLNKGH